MKKTIQALTFSVLFLGAQGDISKSETGKNKINSDVESILKYEDVELNSISDNAKKYITSIDNKIKELISPYDKYNQILEEQLSTIKGKIDIKLYDDIVKELTDEDFKEKIFKNQKFLHDWALKTLVMSLILSILYYIAYGASIDKVKNEHKYINPKSFGIFSVTGLGMTLINGFIPGSFVYTLSSYLAGHITYLHLKNVREGKVSNINEKTLLNFIEENPLPLVRYDKNGKPLVWNKKMEEETGYNLNEILDYYNKNGEVMSLLYKGDELIKVNKYLSNFEKTQVGYKNVAFTMTTKSGEQKTFLWTTMPDGEGGTLRTALHLTNENEIKKELYETQKLLKFDYLTGALNKQAFEEDLKKLLTLNKRTTDKSKYIFVIFDIDNFKGVNDNYGHNFGDEVLEELSKTISSSLREKDRFYRIGGDEFALLFETSNIDVIVKKINKLKEEFYSKKIILNDKQISNFGTSWGVKKIDFGKLKIEDENLKTEMIKNLKDEVDYYMYIVKYLFYIKEELISRGIDSESFIAKNAIAYPIFSDDNVLIGINILGKKGSITISQKDIDLIVSRKENNKDKIGKRNLS